MPKKVRITMTFDQGVLDRLDVFREGIPRSTMVNQIVKEITQLEDN